MKTRAELHNALLMQGFFDKPAIETEFKRIEMDNKTRKTVPIEIKNVDLRVDISINTLEEFQKFERIQELLQRMRATFGDNVLIEELSQVLCGQIEKVTLTGGPLELPTDRKALAPSFNQAPKPVAVPSLAPPPAQPPTSALVTPPAPPAALYVIVSDCPWKGLSLQTLNPEDVARILQDPIKKSVLHPQDAFYMQEYVNNWAVQQPRPLSPAVQGTLELDSIPY